MDAESFIKMVEEARNELVKINDIKHPEYDSYINGWDDCIDFLWEHISDISKSF